MAKKVLVIVIIFLIGFGIGRGIKGYGRFWKFEKINLLPAYKQSAPCLQVALFIEGASNAVVEPFSPYRPPVGKHVFHADPQEVVKCALDMGTILVAYIQQGGLSKQEHQEALHRLLGVVRILCSTDFLPLPSNLEKRRRALLSTMEYSLPVEYNEVRVNIQYYCNIQNNSK